MEQPDAPDDPLWLKGIVATMATNVAAKVCEHLVSDRGFPVALAHVVTGYLVGRASA